MLCRNKHLETLSYSEGKSAKIKIVEVKFVISKKTGGKSANLSRSEGKKENFP
jgi:hypothetical protein